MIGCDGANSVVADFLGLKPPEFLSLSHFRNEYVQFTGDHSLIARIPIYNKLVYWFMTMEADPKGSAVAKDPELIQQLTLDSINGFPTEW